MPKQKKAKSIDDLITINQNILYRSDCKEALQELINKGVKVDLIYLDPPFNSNRVYSMIYKGKGKTAQQKAFSDMWSYTSQTKQMLSHFKENLEMQTGVSDIVKNFLKIWIESIESMSSRDKKMLAYLIYMAERLVLMKEILKDTGSLYLHCDPTASHYIKIIMDGIFGYDNFRNEIVWHYRRYSAKSQDFQRMHDILLRYSRSENFIFNTLYQEYQETNKKNHPWEKDEEGKKFYWKRGKDIEAYRVYENVKGVRMNDVWIVPQMSPISKERLGYPTQKPLKLLERVIEASSNEGDLILDTFCGCGTTLVASIKLNRKWIGIDISPIALDVVKKRLKDNLLGRPEYDYIELDGSPDSKNAYDKLNPYQKQDFLIKKVGGSPSEKYSGDGGVDGEMTLHLGNKKDRLGNLIGEDIWGKMIFSVKTGKQYNPAMVRELWGTMEKEKAFMGGLILEEEASDGMEETAENKGNLEYTWKEDIPPNEYPKIQILTAQEIIDGHTFSTPPTMMEIRDHRKGDDLF